MVEPRNDENQIIAQIHAAFLRLHNNLVDEGMSFAEARRTVIENYQWVVLHDFRIHGPPEKSIDLCIEFAVFGLVNFAASSTTPEKPPNTSAQSA